MVGNLESKITIDTNETTRIASHAICVALSHDQMCLFQIEIGTANIVRIIISKSFIAALSTLLLLRKNGNQHAGEHPRCFTEILSIPDIVELSISKSG